MGMDVKRPLALGFWGLPDTVAACGDGEAVEDRDGGGDAEVEGRVGGAEVEVVGACGGG